VIDIDCTVEESSANYKLAKYQHRIATDNNEKKIGLQPAQVVNTDTVTTLKR